MIAVADASPLCYLILIGQIDLLPKLFLHVAVPRAVITELLHEDAPEAQFELGPRTYLRGSESKRIRFRQAPAWRHFKAASKLRSSWRSP
jgi:hypothetical protein